MLGAIVGDTVGSIYEYNNTKDYNFELFTNQSGYTDENESDDGGMVDMKKIDPKFEEAARLVLSTGRASTSYLQTQMGMGFARSAKVMSQLEAAGIVGPQNSSKNREVLVQTFAELDEIIKRFKNQQ
ncbi:MAG: hypothetical protein IJZ70_07955 [Bacteroidales bacterium]|nr:hypothetical protein [Bacteroidales bacterium]